MKRTALLPLVLVIGAPQMLTAQSEEQAVLEAAQDLFDAMRANDTARIRSLFDPGARLVGVLVQADSGISNSRTLEEFVALFASGSERYLERMWEPEVRIEGPIATIWTPYDFHRNGEFSHCGIDAFQLVKTGGAWKILSIIYTVRPAACDSPLGQPRHEGNSCHPSCPSSCLTAA